MRWLAIALCSKYDIYIYPCPGRCSWFRPIESDGGPDVAAYNEALKDLSDVGKGTWFTAPWLYAEYEHSFSVVLAP